MDLYAKRCWLHTSFFFNARSWVGTDTENRDFFKSCVTKILHDISFLQVCKSRWQNPLFFLGHKVAFLGCSFHKSLTDRQCWQESQMWLANFLWDMHRKVETISMDLLQKSSMKVESLWESKIYITNVFSPLS